MSRSAAGMDYSPFQFFQKLVLSRSRGLYYIGGSDVLPAPLEPKREAYVISKLKTEQEQEARSLLIEHNLRLVVYIAKKFDNTGVGVEDLISIGTIGLIKARKRNTLLMYYFLEMTESEIANLQKITQSGVFKNRHHALETMKKILKEKQ